jgi:hypothetical protein
MLTEISEGSASDVQRDANQQRRSKATAVVRSPAPHMPLPLMIAQASAAFADANVELDDLDRELERRGHWYLFPGRVFRPLSASVSPCLLPST